MSPEKMCKRRGSQVGECALTSLNGLSISKTLRDLVETAQNPEKLQTKHTNSDMIEKTHLQCHNCFNPIGLLSSVFVLKIALAI